MKLIEQELIEFNKILFNEINSYSNEISKNLVDLISAKSKRIRPILIILLAKSLNINISDKIMHLAVATELIHTATLIHDDIIDNAETRRGTISINVQLGNNLSVLSGDLLLGYSLNELSLLNNFEVINTFTKSLINICTGEINQQFHIDKIPSFDEYINKSKYKTAELFSAALNSLCIIEKIPQQKEVNNFAQNFGIAFQLKDDLKNILKTDDTKPSLSDIHNGIYTLAVILLSKNKNIENYTKPEIINEINTNPNIIKETNKIIEQYATSAIDSLNFIKDNQYKNKLIELTKNLYKAE